MSKNLGVFLLSCFQRFLGKRFVHSDIATVHCDHSVCTISGQHFIMSPNLLAEETSVTVEHHVSI